MSDSPFKMPGSQHLGRGNQSVSPGKYTASPAKDAGHKPERPKGHKHSDEDPAEMTGSVNAPGDKVINASGNWVKNKKKK